MQPQQEVLCSVLRQLRDDPQFNHTNFQGHQLVSHAHLVNEEMGGDQIVNQMLAQGVIAKNGKSYKFTQAVDELIGPSSEEVPELSTDELRRVIDTLRTTIIRRDGYLVSTKKGFELALLGVRLPYDVTFDQLWKQLNDGELVKPFNPELGHSPLFEISQPTAETKAA